jgi:hypothetical protein
MLQVLSCQGKILNGAVSLRDQGIRTGDIVHLSVRLLGGGKDERGKKEIKQNECIDCGCTWKGKWDNGQGCCSVCSLDCECRGCGFEAGTLESSGHTDIQEKKRRDASSVASAKEEYERVKKFGTTKEKRDYVMDRVKASMDNKTYLHYFTYRWKVGDFPNCVECCKVN